MRSSHHLLMSLFLLAGCADATQKAVDTTSSNDITADTASVDITDAEDITIDTGLDTASSDAGVDTAEPDIPQPETDPTDAMFDPNRLLNIEVTIPPEDWNALRFQTRTFYDLFGPGCMQGPFESPFTYFKADVRIDGVLVEDVGLRKKGFLGSMTPDRPSLKVKFAEYVDNPEFEGMKRLTLNNSRQDPS